MGPEAEVAREGHEEAHRPETVGLVVDLRVLSHDRGPRRTHQQVIAVAQKLPAEILENVRQLKTI